MLTESVLYDLLPAALAVMLPPNPGGAVAPPAASGAAQPQGGGRDDFLDADRELDPESCRVGGV